MLPVMPRLKASGLFLLMASLPFLLGGCFAMQKDLDPIRSDISVLEKQFVELQREQARLSGGGAPAGAPAQSNEQLAERVRRLEQRLDALEARQAGKPAAQSQAPATTVPAPMAPEPVVVEPIPEQEPEPPVLVNPGPGAAVEAPPGESTAGTSPEEIYTKAMAEYKSGDTATAENGFRHVLEGYPDSRLADNAEYWLGDISFTKKDYARALEMFRKVISDYPVGDKVPDAVYMMGRSYEELGQKDKAREAYNRVMDNYPYSDAARNARQRLDGIY